MSSRVGVVARCMRSGQATVEFTLAFMVFALLLLGAIDVSRALFAQHGVSRAAESVAHALVVQYAASPTPMNCSGAWLTAIPPMLQTAQRSSGVSFNTSTSPCSFTSAAGYQYISNGTVIIDGLPDLNLPQTLCVTVKSNFQPASSLFIGGRSMTLASTAAGLTSIGQANSGLTQPQCPSH